MSDFRDQIEQIKVRVAARNSAIFVNSCAAMKDSITDGSAITGSPGQLVRSGNLKASWQLSFPSQTEAIISTNAVYARQMEDGTREGRALTQRSPTGGFHSVALTIAGLGSIVADQATRVAQ